MTARPLPLGEPGTPTQALEGAGAFGRSSAPAAVGPPVAARKAPPLPLPSAASLAHKRVTGMIAQSVAKQTLKQLHGVPGGTRRLCCAPRLGGIPRDASAIAGAVRALASGGGGAPLRLCGLEALLAAVDAWRHDARRGARGSVATCLKEIVRRYCVRRMAARTVACMSGGPPSVVLENDGALDNFRTWERRRALSFVGPSAVPYPHAALRAIALGKSKNVLRCGKRDRCVVRWHLPHCLPSAAEERLGIRCVLDLFRRASYIQDDTTSVSGARSNFARNPALSARIRTLRSFIPGGPTGCASRNC